MFYKSVIFVFCNLCVLNTNSHTTQMPSRNVDSNPFLDIATSFLQEALVNQNSGQNGGGGMAGIAQLIGSLMQPDASGKSNNGGLGAAQILSGISSLMANANGGGNGDSSFDPSIIGSVIEMFTAGSDSDDDEQPSKREKRANDGSQIGVGIETLVNIASAFMGNVNDVNGESSGKNEGIMSLLPMVIQAVNSFSGPEGDRVHDKHKDHQWVLPPFLERIHVMWDHFSNSELAEALWEKSGVNSIFKVR